MKCECENYVHGSYIQLGLCSLLSVGVSDPAPLYKRERTSESFRLCTVELIVLKNPNWTDLFQDLEVNRDWAQVCRLRLGDLTADPVEVLQPLTVPEEHERARRYRFDADRHRHLAGRALVRVLLSSHLDCPPREIAIGEGPHGKPRVKKRGAAMVPDFNIAHSGEVIVAVLGGDRGVGIDVESQNRDANVEELAERVLSENEQEWWQSFPVSDRSALFFHVWTCKEAFLKALGKGLQRPPQTIECTFEENTVVGLDDAQGYTPSSTEASASQWSVQSFRASDGVAGAVVVSSSASTPVVFTDASRLVNSVHAGEA